MRAPRRSTQPSPPRRCRTDTHAYTLYLYSIRMLPLMHLRRGAAAPYSTLVDVLIHHMYIRRHVHIHHISYSDTYIHHMYIRRHVHPSYVHTQTCTSIICTYADIIDHGTSGRGGSLQYTLYFRPVRLSVLCITLYTLYRPGRLSVLRTF